MAFRNCECEACSRVKVVANIPIGSIHNIFDGDRLERYPPREANQEAAANAPRKRIVHGSCVRTPNKTRAYKDERRIPSFIGERIGNAIKLYMKILAGGVKIWEVAKQADSVGNVVRSQAVPAVKTDPMAGWGFRSLVDVPGARRTPSLSEARPR